ncbi:MAG TPA: ATP-binding cassette domain-containing protein [candidate division WOR-3 bacterium]|uniref:ATP-binding cassette domain-containing protein n=1 Tax=candidate division WOR-3 bacterium TaxID=2052148 RepID=A0A7C5I4T7_UNCW3|nr:ATP-binding cassette domain-containing protein [candidate division WOR-3 bacterium]
MGDPAVRAENISRFFQDKKRGTVKAVDSLSFEVKSGEIFAILGPNGAGKTTTLRVLSTILRPTFGMAYVNGYNIIEKPDKVRQSIGYLPSESGLYHRLTPYEVISLFGRLSGLKGNTLKRRVDELVESLGMQKFAHTRIEKLSTGMKQKVKVARTIVHDPPVLILDEPTQGLDVPSSQIVEKFIKEERDKGKTIILSTHIMEEAEYLADRILVIHKGRKRAEGTMEELRKMTGKTRLKEVFLQLIKEDRV